MTTNSIINSKQLSEKEIEIQKALGTYTLANGNFHAIVDDITFLDREIVFTFLITSLPHRGAKVIGYCKRYDGWRPSSRLAQYFRSIGGNFLKAPKSGAPTTPGILAILIGDYCKVETKNTKRYKRYPAADTFEMGGCL